MSKQYVIGIDIGTSGCKTLIIDHEGEVVRRAVEEYPLFTPRAGWSEQDPEHWWQAVLSTLKKILHGFQSIDGVKGIGLSGQMHGLVALDDKGGVLRRAILWNDQRTGEQCRKIHVAAGGIDGLLKLTNNQMLPGVHRGQNPLAAGKRAGHL